MITVTHKKVSAVPDGFDKRQVQPSDWNEVHQIDGIGTLAEQDANAVAITGGNISNAAFNGGTMNNTVMNGGTINGATIAGLAFNKASIASLLISAVSAALPALSFVDACFHLAKNDTDKGAWRKRKGQSWRSEVRTTGKYLGAYANGVAAVNAQSGAVGDYYYDSTTGAFEAITGITGTPPAATATTEATTYRAGGEDYPTNALITAEAARVIIWDLDGGSPTMWMVFVQGATNALTANVTGLAAMNGTIVVSSATSGVYKADYNKDKFVCHATTGYIYNGNLSQRNSASNYRVNSVEIAPIINATVNSVAITVLPDAPLDEFGMPVPTIYAFTAGGVSRIAHDGTVSSTATTLSVLKGGIYKNNVLGVTASGGYVWTKYPTSSALPAGGAGHLGSYWGNFIDYPSYSANNSPSALTLTGFAAGMAGDAIGGAAGLRRCIVNESSVGNSIAAEITNAYNTGWMVGDIRACFYANSLTADRSVNGLTLTTVGAVTETVNAGGRNVYSGYSAANYSQIASNAAFNALGTGDFSILMSAVKWGAAGSNRAILSVGNGASAGSVILFALAANTLSFRIHNGTTFAIAAESTATFTDAAEHVLEVKRVGTTLSILVDGVVVATTTGGNAALTISNATGFLRIGERQDATQPWIGGQSACVRISATAPTAEQSAYIAATENALNGGAACLLSNSASVSALAYDRDTDTLLVGNGTAADTFKSLARVASQAHGVTTLKALAWANGCTLIAGTGATYSAPVRNVGAELLEPQPSDKNPVFKQITTDSTGLLKFPRGMKPVSVFTAAGAYVSLASSVPTFDGFVWSIAGLAASTAYDCNLVSA